MTIAIVTPVYPPYRGGIGKAAALEADFLKSSGQQVKIFTNRNGLRIGNAAWCPQFFWQLRDFDVVHLHYPFFGAAEYIRKPRHGRLVVTYHMDTVGRGWQGRFFSVYQKWVMPRVLARADRIIVSSLDYLKSSAAAFLYDLNHSKFYEVPFGVDDVMFHPSSLKSYEGQVHASEEIINNATHKNVRLLFVGGLDRAHYFKGLPVLLRALRDLKANYFELQIVGDGDLRREYEVLAAEYGLTKHVTFFGNVSDEQLAAVYREADIFVFPSIDRSEAFGLAVLEAMASGLPVIASDLPGVRTLVENGQIGFLFTVNDKNDLIKKLLLFKDPATRQRMGHEARLRVDEKYNLELWQRRMKEVLFGEI